MQKVKSGFIFIPFESDDSKKEVPPNYVGYFLGAFGVYAKLDSKSPNGFDYISLNEYENA